MSKTDKIYIPVNGLQQTREEGKNSLYGKTILKNSFPFSLFFGNVATKKEKSFFWFFKGKRNDLQNVLRTFLMIMGIRWMQDLKSSKDVINRKRP